MTIAAIDHWVLVVKDLEATFALYRKLGLEPGWQERPGGRGTRPIIRISETQKLNLSI
jgi:catechol 2,3-dioxygenase-like lactoylglutathione lyase family enzyme